MASRTNSKRREPAPKNSPAVDYDPDDDALEDSLAYEHGFLPDEDEEESPGYLQQASDRVRGLTHQREGRVVIAALAGGFAIGAAIGCVIANSRHRKESWTDRLACEGLGRRLLDRIGTFSSSLPESITEKFRS
ncbi:MAG: hypothetical protein AB7G28_14765 [Pirellulales bacterium]